MHESERLDGHNIYEEARSRVFSRRKMKDIGGSKEEREDAVGEATSRILELRKKTQKNDKNSPVHSRPKAATSVVRTFLMNGLPIIYDKNSYSQTIHIIIDGTNAIHSTCTVCLVAFSSLYRIQQQLNWHQLPLVWHRQDLSVQRLAREYQKLPPTNCRSIPVPLTPIGQ